MKILITSVLVIALTAVTKLKAQNLYASAAYESTIVGGQWSASLGYHTRKGLMLGAFYQIGKNHYDAKASVNTDLYGMELFFPLIKSEKITFAAHIRTGIANNRFFVIIPGAETMIYINRCISVGPGLSWRYGHAAVDARLVFQM